MLKNSISKAAQIDVLQPILFYRPHTAWVTFQRGLKRHWGDLVHGALVAVMAGWAIILMTSSSVFGTSESFRWFVANWPHTEFGWSLAFAGAAAVGVIGLFVKNRWLQLCTITVLGCAHGSLTLAIWEGNDMSTGTVAYGVFASLALVRIVVHDMRASGR